MTPAAEAPAFAGTDACPAGKQTRRLSFEYVVRAWDYRGNLQTSGPHRIIYDATPN
jgi:hypothetical protein